MAANFCYLQSTGLVDVLEGSQGVLVYEEHKLDVAPQLRQLIHEPAPTLPTSAMPSLEHWDWRLSLNRLHAPLLTSLSLKESFEELEEPTITSDRASYRSWL